MADVHDKETRSYNMSRIKGKNTKPEMVVRKFLHANGFRYRLHVKNLPGKPDIVLPKYKTVIFVHGCFWHQHEHCSKASLPKTRTEWWKNKLNRNTQVDLNAEALLKQSGWRVLIIWQCGLTINEQMETLSKLIADIMLCD
jgi:DNA mismatch endonuclease (patch repair protein)